MRFVATHSIPAMPVPLTGKVSAFFVRKTSRSRAQVSSMMARYCGSRWPSVGAPSARSTRCGTGLGPGPSRMRSAGKAVEIEEVMVGDVATLKRAAQ